MTMPFRVTYCTRCGDGFGDDSYVAFCKDCERVEAENWFLRGASLSEVPKLEAKAAFDVRWEDRALDGDLKRYEEYGLVADLEGRLQDIAELNAAIARTRHLLAKIANYAEDRSDPEISLQLIAELIREGADPPDPPLES